jgi:dTDP-4-dehydrorhamnose 3,5-epimerase-like enzyme
VTSGAASDDQLRARFGSDVTRVSVTPNVDERGRLVEFDFAALPFPVRRVFAVTDVPAGTERGGHRHRRADQALFCLAGRVEVELRRGESRHDVTMTPDTGCLCVRAGVWARQGYVADRSELLVFASEPFDPGDYDSGW